MNRRDLFRTATGAALASGLSPVRAAAASAPGYHLGCVTYNLLAQADLETLIRWLTAAGFEGVELRTSHKHGVEPTIDAAARESVRKLFEQSKVRLYSYGTTCEFHSADAAVRRKNVETAKQFVDLAADTGAAGVKVRPNGFAKEVPHEATIANIGAALREVGDYAAAKKIGVWLEIHGRETSNPVVCSDIMKATRHPAVGLCWNSNEGDIVNGSVRQNFDLVKPWIRHVHINELAKPNYPWRELFTLLKAAGYQGFTLAEVAESKEPERFLRWYKALWTELTRDCA
jgi:sugar phosphate isomerase/epimerase